MTDKYRKRLNQYIEDLFDEKYELFENADQLIHSASAQVETLAQSEMSLSEKEALLLYVTQVLSLFTELNHSVLKFVETHKSVTPASLANYNVENGTNLPYCSKTSALKTAQETYGITEQMNESSQNSSSVANNIEKQFLNDTVVVNETVPDLNKCDKPLVLSNSNSIYSSTNSSGVEDGTASLNVCQELIIGSVNTSERRVNVDLQKVKENLTFFQSKMGFWSEDLPQKQIQSEQNFGIKGLAEPPGASGKSVTDLETSDLVKSASAIKEEVPFMQHSMGSSSSNDSSIPHSWESVSSEPSSQATLILRDTGATAVDKLAQAKIYDRNEVAREKARTSMWNLKLVPVEPDIIKSNLVAQKGAKKKNKNRENVKTRRIPPMETPQEGTICVFSFIVSPAEFYLQLVDAVHMGNLGVISAKLQDGCHGTKLKLRNKRDAFERLGKYCCSYIPGEDRDAWYRVKVLDWHLGSNTDEVEVQAIDYGFKCTTSYTNLRILSRRLAEIPQLAIKCHFPLLLPPDSAQWSEGTSDALYDIAKVNRNSIHESNNPAFFEIVFAKLESDSLAVDLAPYPSVNIADTLGSLLVEMGLAQDDFNCYADNLQEEAQTSKFTQQDEACFKETHCTSEYAPLNGAKEDDDVDYFIQDVNDLDDADNLNEVILGYDARDEARICKFTRKDGTCFKGKNCMLEHVPSNDGYTTDKLPIYHSELRDLVLPLQGETVQVLITEYVDSCTYLVQLIRNPVNVAHLKIPVEREFAELLETLNLWKSVSKFETFKMNPAVGEIALAEHPLLNIWTRVLVRGIKPDVNDILEVFAVDFGNVFSVHRKNLRKIKQEFLLVPFQTVQIYLERYQQSDQCDAVEARNFFHEHMAYRRFQANIRSNQPPLKTLLTTFKGTDIGTMLVQKGFAKTRVNDLNMTENRIRGIKLDLE